MKRDISESMVKCPSCAKRGVWFETPYGPFCSQRCRMVDLGKWLGEEHIIFEPLRPEHFQFCGEPPADQTLDESEIGTL